MKSCCLAYIQQRRSRCCFCPNCNGKQSNCTGFLILKFEHSLFFEKFDLVSKIFICRLLSHSFSDLNAD